jgi:hypothetical protein
MPSSGDGKEGKYLGRDEDGGEERERGGGWTQVYPSPEKFTMRGSQMHMLFNKYILSQATMRVR